MKFLALVPALVLASSFSHAFEASPSLLQKYYRGNFSFDGTKVSNNDSNTSFNNKERWVKAKLPDSQYNMNWSSEKIENSEVLTVSESLYTNNGKDNGSTIYARTSSFNGNKLRASTICYGDSFGTSSDLKCVTASKRACDRLMTSYRAESKKNKNIGKVRDTVNKAENCTSLMGSYAAMAESFGNQSDQMESRHNQVIDQDLSRLKKHIKDSTGNKFWSFTSLSSATTSKQLAETAQQFSGSMDGIRALNAAIQTCSESLGDFSGGTSSDNNGSSRSGSGVK